MAPPQVASADLTTGADPAAAADGSAKKQPRKGVGMVTCAASQYDTSSNLPYSVVAPLVLVFDRRDMNGGEVVGCLQAADVAVAIDVKLPWIMLAKGSFVRFPQMKKGRIKLKSDGWLLVHHTEYGTLLSAENVEEVKAMFKDNAFAKPPMVKLAPAEKKEDDEEPARARPSVGAAADATGQAPPAKPSEPPASPQPQPRAAKPAPGAPAPAAAAAPAPPAAAPDAAAPPRPASRGIAAGGAGAGAAGARAAAPSAAPPAAAAKAAPAAAAAKAAAAPKAASEAASKADTPFDVEAARALQLELLEKYKSAEFVERCEALDAVWEKSPTKSQADKLLDMDQLTEHVMRPIIPRYGFDATRNGYLRARQAVSDVAGSFKDVREKQMRIRSTIYGYFKHLHPPPDPAGSERRAQDASTTPPEAASQAASKADTPFDVEAARALQMELLEKYKSAEFVERCEALDARWEKKPMLSQEDKLLAMDQLTENVMRSIIPRYGFDATRNGYLRARQAVTDVARSFKDVREKQMRIRSTIYGHFKHLHSPPDPAGRERRAQDASTTGSSVRPPQLSAKAPPEPPARQRTEVVFWGICDIKYDSALPKEDRIVVLELGDGRASRFSGCGSYIKDNFDSEYYMSDTPLKRSIMVDNKKVTHDMFVRAGYVHLRPRTGAYPRRYTPELAPTLVKDLGLQSGDAAVLKLLNRARGAGVVVVTPETADGVLHRLLVPPTGEQMNAWLDQHSRDAQKACFGFDDPLEECCLHWWSNECPVFVAERCCHSTMVPMESGSDQLFDGTLRVAFALRQMDQSIPGASTQPFEVDWLGGYWKLPRVASNGSDSQGTTPEDLHNRIVSSFNSAEKRTAPVPVEDLQRVYEVLSPALPQIFQNGGLVPETVERIYKDEPLFRAFATARVACAIRLSDMAKARALLEQARKLVAAPVNFSALELPERSVLSYIERNLGVNCSIEGKWEEAGVHWRRAIRICAPNATAHYLEGCYHQVNGDYSHGVRCMQRSIALDPDFRSSYIGLSNCYLLDEAFEQAIEACDCCLHRFPDALGAQFNLGQAIYQTLRRNYGSLEDSAPRIEAAIRYYESAKSQAPDFWTPDDKKVLQWFQTSDVLVRARMPRQAVHIWRVFGWRP